MRLSLLVAVVLLSCRQLPPEEAEPLRANVRARDIWKAHEAVVARAVSGETKNDEFSEACHFFEETTGIVVHGEGTFFGWMPTKETAGDLDRLRAWYRTNAELLYADDGGHVRVRPRRHTRATTWKSRESEA